jgi:hypothetical protein
MNPLFRVCLFIAIGFSSASAADSDTIKLKSNGAEINGTVTFSNATFQIEAGFKNGKRRISINNNAVSEVQFNNVTDNPEDDAPSWVLHLNEGAQASPSTRVVVRFLDSNTKDSEGNLDTITSDTISVQGEKYPKPSVRWVRLAP